MQIQRRQTTQVFIGKTGIGSDFPVAVQSMTNTPTADFDATLMQIQQLAQAGSELVRITINDEAAARSAVKICQHLRSNGINTPIIGDFHFNGHRLLSDGPELAELLSKYRINPGNLGRGGKHDAHFQDIIRIAVAHQKPVRIGVNSGSVDPDLLQQMKEDGAKNFPLDKEEGTGLCDAMVESALQSARRAIELGLPEDKIILSAKASEIQDLIYIYRTLAHKCRFPLHLGLTEAGAAEQGIVSSAAAMAILLQEGIGDTMRVSLTPDESCSRTKEVEICQHILQSLGVRFFYPKIISCPGCGRTSTKLFQQLLKTVRKYVSENFSRWQKEHPGVERMTIAVMGCVVNGPGESKHADIGISLPNGAEDPTAIPVYIRGAHAKTLKGEHAAGEFLSLLEEFIVAHY